MLLRPVGAQAARSLRPCAFACARRIAIAGVPARNMPLKAKLATPIGQPKVQSMSTAAANSDDDVLFCTNYGVRAIELNRPKAHNALSGSMAKKILERLREYEKSQLANIIVIKGAGPRAFCAGGDVVVLAEQNIKTKGGISEEGAQKSTEYFALEYTLDHLIATYSKPYVAFIDGHTMGGGVGLSVHAPFRIATERTTFAMPETRIGFFTDVGGSFFLPRMDGQLGMYLALTSEILKGVDTLYAGVATHYIDSSSLPDLEARLAELKFPDGATLEEKYEIIDSTIEEFNTGLPDTPFSLAGEKRRLIDKCFSPSNLSDVLTALGNNSKDPFIAQTLAAINERCPLSILVTFALLRLGSHWTISDAFQREYIVASRFMRAYDFPLGVRNLLVHKKATPPKWNTPPLDKLIANKELSERLLEEFLSPKEGVDVRLPLDGRGVDYDRYPHWWIGLPSEAEIEQKVKATVAGGPGGRMNRGQLVQYFVDTRRGKLGVREKVTDVLERKTVLDQAGWVDWLYEKPETFA